MIIDWADLYWTTPFGPMISPVFIWVSMGSSGPTPVVTGGDEANKVRVGIVAGVRISDGNPSVGGMF